jgi:hypothetical protein
MSEFNLKNVILGVFTTSLGFVFALSMNNALTSTTDLIKINNTNKCANAWINLVIVGTLVTLALYILYRMKKTK